jgi:hypothetical protein
VVVPPVLASALLQIDDAIRFVHNFFAKQGFEQIFQGDEAGDAAVFVRHNRDMPSKVSSNQLSRGHTAAGLPSKTRVAKAST